MDEITRLIVEAAQRNGVDPDTLTKIGRVESGLDPNARNPRSSAGGLFQFIDGTARQYGLGNKFDPAQSADAGARLMRDNLTFLRSRLGRDPTPGELYLAHQQGSGGAAKLLTQPDAPAEGVVGSQAFRLNGGRPGMTAGQFSAMWDAKLNGAKGGAPSPSLAAAVVGPTPAPMTSFGGFLPSVPQAPEAPPASPLALAAAGDPAAFAGDPALPAPRRKQPQPAALGLAKLFSSGAPSGA